MQIIICSFWHGWKSFLTSVLLKYWSKTGFLLLLKARLVAYSWVLGYWHRARRSKAKANQLLQEFKIIFLALQEEECSCDIEAQHYFLPFTWYLCKVTAGYISQSWVGLGKAPLLFSHLIWKTPQSSLHKPAGWLRTIQMSTKCCSKRQAQIKV